MLLVQLDTYSCFFYFPLWPFLVWLNCEHIRLYCLNHMPIYSSIAVYKALYKSFGGFAADVVAAIDQVSAICLAFLKTITYQTADVSSVGFLTKTKNNLIYMYHLPVLEYLILIMYLHSRLPRMGLT